MKGRLSRRELIAASASLAALACAPVTNSSEGKTGYWAEEIYARLAELAERAEGTLGASVLDPGSGAFASWNGDRRFPHCSSFKVSLAAMVLDLVARGQIDGKRLLHWSEADLMWVSPFTTRRLGQGATFLELARATQVTSDNTAANVLLRELGGPEALTAWWRALGDGTSRLDRTEPALNRVLPGEVHDTTTPDAMARTMATILYGDALAPSVSERLASWMAKTETGSRRVRADLPDRWRAGDKTGTAMIEGMGSAYVDIGFVVPDGRGPLTFATYYMVDAVHDDMDPQAEALLAEVGRTIAAVFAR
ncbi:hypothetical protein A3736_00295 [Erythrobacter sp. HI0063]|jgi:beta-lactamase class A|uniref:class A beta-lactamase n=1 Tax=Erythrobacter sp. HI0063 TaxID=1822240 RepID=UPI0007C2C2A4|nr:class A beta-lactamase [Erythrobacter sp. HI0063]KZY57756.1 hypothetical protein A3736_00295 [Erythrobacter sp. HI0063]